MNIINRLIKHITPKPRLLAAAPALVILALSPIPAIAQQDTEVEETAEDIAASEGMLLLGAADVEIPGETDDIDIPIPSHIKRSANHLILNGADWSALRQAFKSCQKKPVSIVHIGDSHIQADISSGTTRRLLQYDFGNAGRGLVAPLKMSSTNQPTDYSFQSRGSWNPVKLMSRSWQQTVGFTGLSIRPVQSSSQLTIATVSPDDYDPFQSVTIFHSGRMNVTSVRDADGRDLHYRAIPSRDYTQILLTEQTDHVDISFASAGDLTVFGASLSGDRPGIFYHTIGNNGAAYDTYNRIGNVGAGISPLAPDLVILSMGTNEAFGKRDIPGFTRAMDRLVANIRATNPGALILLTTPMECQKSVTTTQKQRVRNKKTKKYQTVNKKVKSYAVNTNIAPIRQAILDYGKQKGIAVYDWYEVAGGSGASSTWVSDGLFAKDRVHHTHRGYNIEGRLLYEALLDALRD